MKNRFIIAGVDRTKDILFTQSNRPTIERRLRQEADCRFVVKSNPRPSEGEEIIIYNQDNPDVHGIIDGFTTCAGQASYPYSHGPGLPYRLNQDLVVRHENNHRCHCRDILTKLPELQRHLCGIECPVVSGLLDYKNVRNFQELCDYGLVLMIVRRFHFFNPGTPETHPMIIRYSDLETSGSIDCLFCKTDYVRDDTVSMIR